MKGRIAYRGFQELWNCHLAGGVEPLGVATLLTPTNGVRDGLEPTVVAPLLVFFAASSEALFFAVASTVAFLFAAASSEAFFFPATSSAAIFLIAVSLAAFFFTASSVVPLLRPHPKPFSLQRPLLPSPRRPQLNYHWTP
jgi:hypothetical protein